MEEILKHIAGVILGALALKYLGLNKKQIIHSEIRPVHWIWRGMKVLGEFMSIYGFLVFALNILVGGQVTNNASIGVSLMSLGIVFWVISGITVFIKRGY